MKVALNNLKIEAASFVNYLETQRSRLQLIGNLKKVTVLSGNPVIYCRDLVKRLSKPNKRPIRTQHKAELSNMKFTSCLWLSNFLVNRLSLVSQIDVK